MKETLGYLTEIATRLVASPVVAAITIVAEYASEDRGYFRARMTLVNGEFLEVSEYFIIQAGTVATLEYRYQWMDHDRQMLIRRWDNARHFPELPHFPHHVHVGNEEPVAPGSAMSIIALLELVERELAEHSDQSGT